MRLKKYSLLSALRARRVRRRDDYNKAIIDREAITENGGKDECADDGLRLLLRLILMEKVAKSSLHGVDNACTYGLCCFVCSHQTIVCRGETMVCRRQTIVWWEQTKK